MEKDKFTLISRKDAVASGLTRYFTGKPCKNSHIKERRVSTMDCVECSKIRQQSDKTKEYKSKNYIKNKELVLKKASENYLKNKTAKLNYAKNYQKNNIKKIIAYQIQYKSKKAANNPAFKLSLSIKASISFNLKRIGKFKEKAPTLKYVGCNLHELKTHIERQFLPNMNWSNRHEWHIDHIVPIATAKTIEDVIALNHFSNLRPLWAKDNLKKSDKLEFLI